DIATTNGTTNATVALTGSSVKWYVEAQFPGCPSTFSDPATFQLVAVDPCANRGQTQLVAPTDNATLPSANVLFDWNGVPNAAGYRLWGSLDGAPFAVLGTTGDTQFAAVVAKGYLEWYVEAQFNGCPSTESAHRTLYVPPAQNCNNAA